MKYDEIIQTVKNERMEVAIAAAAELYLEKGIDDVKMTDIADRCQLGVASLYRYFGTKQLFTVKVGAHIWKERMDRLVGFYRSEAYRQKVGIDQIRALMDVFHVLLTEHTDFLRFISEFDAFVVREGLTQQELSEYEQSVLNVMPLMEQAFEKGRADGTVKSDVPMPLYYVTVSHSLMSMCQKFARGRIFASDYPQGGEQELRMAIEMYVSYVRA